MPDAEDRHTSQGLLRWGLALGPLVLLALVIFLFVRADPTRSFLASFPPVEDLTIERISFPEPGRLVVHVVNGGPEPVTIAQVMVDEAYWRFEMEDDPVVGRLESERLTLDYPWVQGEPHVISIVTATGLKFDHEVAVATVSPRPDAGYLTTFAILGIYAGVVPVLLGLLWYPFLRRIGRKWLHFFLSLTIGLLLFLVADALEHALEAAAGVPDGFQAIGLIAVGAIGAVLAIRAISGIGSRGRDGNRASGLTVAYMIAIGIGLHNLGEGLAIGAAYALGEIALGSFLVIGFALHNTTEGLAIVAPMAERRPPIWHFLVLGAIAGIPTVLGAWIGGFSYSPVWSTFFLALGAGAIVQVVIEVGRLVQRSWPEGLFTPLNALGMLAGLVIMYGTALFVVA